MGKEYCLYLEYHDNPGNEAVVGYYDTYEEAEDAYFGYPKSQDYVVRIGQFV